MNVKKSSILAIIGLLVIVMAASNVMASGGKRGQTPDQIMSALKERLNLTEEQESQVRPVIEKQVESRKAIFDKYRDEPRENRKSMRDEIKQNREDTEKQLEAILSEEQMKEYKNYLNEKRSERRGKKGKRS
ncbi:MAG: hypothetical protein GY749_29555 [Desulfobacteraceae bacterium]|nr:hypothetical protein [Desulfobacteraceae bacterium]